jgi:thymidine phosphorylase
MVAVLGGPHDVFADSGLASAPSVREVLCERDGVLAAMDTRAIGLAVIALGGGRNVARADIDPRVGFDRIVPLGTVVRRGEALARVHAASEADAERAAAACAAALQVAEAPAPAMPLVHDVVTGV